MLNHASYGFAFKYIDKSVQPFYRNHVNYASFLVLILPYLVYLLRRSKRISQTVFLIASIAFFLLAIYLSYTRAAHLCVFIAIGAYFVIKYKLTRIAVFGTAIIAILGISFLVVGNRYLDFAPDYERTITHTNFNNLLEATYKMEDMSTMERVYRWVAGYQMILDEPMKGFGPGNFYFQYKKYAVSSFKTYVSNNPDKSGIHNYYLMLMVEQGIIGLLIFIGLAVSALFIGQNLYHRLSNREDRDFLMAALLSLIVILAIILINDMIESDKVGPFFFFALAVIAFYYQKLRPSLPTKSKLEP